jgi:hypothetical protein
LARCEAAVRDCLRATFGEPRLLELQGEARRWPAREHLRQARILLDWSCCLLQRHCAASAQARHEAAPIDLHCWADASPASGFEAFASVCSTALRSAEGLQVGPKRLMPLVYLGFGHQALADKVFAFLHGLFLEVGPDLARLRWRLSRIRSWTTDMGVESGLADAQDLLPSFLDAIGSGIVAEQASHLFPRAVHQPGWHHVWDTILRDALSALSWWPDWLRLCRPVVKFMRVASYREVVLTLARDAGFDPRVVVHPPPPPQLCPLALGDSGRGDRLASVGHGGAAGGVVPRRLRAAHTAGSRPQGRH